jgi:hypothetical protein
VSRAILLALLSSLAIAADPPAPRVTDAKDYDNLTVRCHLPGDAADGAALPTLFYVVKPHTMHVDDGVVDAFVREGFAVIELVDHRPNGHADYTWTICARNAMADAHAKVSALFALGFSASAMTVLYAAYSEGGYAGAIAVCHCLPDPPATPAAKATPTLFVTGDQDMNHPAILTLLKSRYVGYATTLMDVPGLDHHLRLDEVPKIAAWMRGRLPKEKPKPKKK